MKKYELRKILTIGIIFLFFVAGITTNLSGQEVFATNENELNEKNIPIVTCNLDTETFYPNDDVDWWPMFQHDVERTGCSTSSAPDTNNVLWRFKAENEYCIRGAVVVDNRVYCGSIGMHTGFPRITIGDHGGYIYCLDATTGDLIWQYFSRYGVYAEPAVVDGRVYVCTGLWYDFGGFEHEGDVLCLNATDGSLIWEYLDSGYVETGPVVWNGNIYFTTKVEEPPDIDEGYVYCLNCENGDLIWARKLHTPRGGVAVGDNRVYVGLANWKRPDHKKFFCLNASTGETIWSWDENNREEIYTTPIVVDDLVYVATMGYGYLDPSGNPVNVPGAIHCLDGLTGDVLWESEANGTFIWSSPAIAYGRLYIGSGTTIVQTERMLRRGDFYCINLTDGRTMWKRTQLSGLGGIFFILEGCLSPAVADGKVFVGSSDNVWGNLHCLDAFTGETIWRYRHLGLLGMGYETAIANGKVYTGFVSIFRPHGWLYCFGDAS